MHSSGSLVAADISKSYGAEPVLAGVTVVVGARARIGLVGPNGVGKSTLLRILTGLERPDAGAVRRSPPSLRVGYLPQEPDARPGETLRAYLARRTGVAAAERELERRASQLGAGSAVAEAYEAALAGFVALGGGDLDARAAAVCARLGLPVSTLDFPTGSLSGGESARAALAAILLSRFDVLLLDEPTNDLDYGGLELLEGFVRTTEAGIVVVSHDREFLDRTISRVVELEEWTHGAREYAGGWSEYEAERARRRARQYREHRHHVEERARVEQEARRMQQWEERGYGHGRKKKKTKNVAGHFRRKLDRLDRDRVDKPYEPWQLRLALGGGARSGDVVAQLRGAVVARAEFRLGPLDLDIGWGERLAVLGPNGAGKTTLLAALLGRAPLAAGSRLLGPGVVVGELEQTRETFASGTLLASFVGESGLAPEQSRTLLAKFGLGPRDVVRDGASLSPGERTRATLALLAARNVNCLVLDEPTNHLDVEAIEELESALERFDGTIVLVTHDRRFLERVGPTRTFELRPEPAGRAATGIHGGLG